MMLVQLRTCLLRASSIPNSRLLLALLDDLLRALPTLLAQSDIDPEPQRQLDEPPAEHEAVFKVAARALRVRNTPGPSEHAALLEQERVPSEREQEDETNGCLRAPVLVVHLDGERCGGEVADAEEGEEDGDEGEGCGRDREISRQRLSLSVRSHREGGMTVRVAWIRPRP